MIPMPAYGSSSPEVRLLKDLHPVEMPREKLARLSPEALSDQELLALVLRTGYGGQDVMRLAAGVLRAFPGDPSAAGYQALRRFKGMGESRAASVVAGAELFRRFHGKQDARALLDSPARVFDHVPLSVKESRKEHLLAFYLNARNQLLSWETVSIGTLSASLVHPREFFSPAVALSAAVVVAVHNHPSGDPEPSQDDKESTKRLQAAGEILGIALMDHVIVAKMSYFSFREHGLLS